MSFCALFFCGTANCINLLSSGSQIENSFEVCRAMQCAPAVLCMSPLLGFVSLLTSDFVWQVWLIAKLWVVSLFCLMWSVHHLLVEYVFVLMFKKGTEVSKFSGSFWRVIFWNWLIAQLSCILCPKCQRHIELWKFGLEGYKPTNPLMHHSTRPGLIITAITYPKPKQTKTLASRFFWHKNSH